MSPHEFPLLLADTMRSEVRWHDLPPAWVLAMVVVPMAALVGWWAYRGERDLPAMARGVLGTLRALALLFMALILFGPYAEVTETRTVRSHLLVLLDTSSSMGTVDGYDPSDASKLAAAMEGTTGDLGGMSRLDVARRVLASPQGTLLAGLAGKFRLHVHTFGSRLTPLVSVGDGDTAAEREEDAATLVRRRLAEVTADQPTTRLGQAVATALDAFRLRDEPVAGIVVISDGQQNGGSLTPLQAGRRASAQRVPVFAVGVGDPRSPMNIHVANLRAKEVVLARDTTVFEFTVRARGFKNRVVRVELQQLDELGMPTGSPLPVDPSSVKLLGGEGEQKIRLTHRFLRAGTYSLRVGVPVQPEEKIKSDNYALHTLRVIDRKIKVLYVEDTPRYEWSYLSNELTRDIDTVRAHVLLLTADPDAPQRATPAAGWHPLDVTQGLPGREALFAYDVMILGDVDWRNLAKSKDLALEGLSNIREFVEKGGGLIMLSGPRNNPSKYKDTPLASVLPVVVDRTAEYTAPEVDSANGFAFDITPEGAESPIMNLTGDPAESVRLWEQTEEWRQRWSYPALRSKTLARVLAVADDPRQENKFGPRPLIATMLYGRGRTLYLGVDELHFIGYPHGDDLYYRFYGEAIRFLATYKLKGGNKRFKIITDRSTYPLDEAVRITLDVLDRDFNPSRDESHTITLDMPGAEPGKRETHPLEIPAVGSQEPGTYRRTIVPTRPGDYKLSAETDDPEDDRPERLFHVVQSTLEGRNLLLDEATLRELAAASDGGAYLRLWDLPSLEVPPRDRQVPTQVEEDELWDNWWSLILAVSLLAAEWMLRKRWHLV